MHETQDTLWIDPDPFTIASLSISAAALVLQFVQTWKDLSGTESSPQSANKYGSLGHLEETVSKIQTELKQLHRTVERGCKESDAEFFDAPLRIGATSLKLDESSHQHFQGQLGSSYATVGNLSQWVNHIIHQDPQLAARLGSRIAGGLEGTAEALNEAMAKGKPNRVVIAECRIALEQLAAAIEAEFASGTN